MNQVIKKIDSVASEFDSLQSSYSEKLNFKKEAEYAKQILQKNSFLMGVAEKNPVSLFNSIKNVAASGLSLSPVTNLAYLVPRDGQVILDVSYRGFVVLAEKSGGIKRVRCEIVRDGDKFEYQGMNKEPLHLFDPFDDRRDVRKIKGAYSVAFLPDNGVCVDIMTIKEIYAIRQRSKAYTSGKSCPWTTDETEMIKKTVIKRAHKLWPTQSHSPQMQNAIAIAHENEGTDFDAEKETEKEKEEEIITRPVDDSEAKERMITAFYKMLADNCKEMNREQKTKLMIDLQIPSKKEIQLWKSKEITIKMNFCEKYFKDKHKEVSKANASFILEN